MKNIAGVIKNLWEKHPFPVIMASAIAFRALAIIFAKGYGMHDDHFCVIEIAERWMNGSREWFTDATPIRSLVYPGLHYVLFMALEKVHVFDPQVKMYVVRFLHGAYSLISVYFGYKTALCIADKKTANTIGLLLAIFWIFPFMAVRNLIEFVCIPPMVVGVYFIYKNPKISAGPIFLSGICFGLAFTLRFQTLSMAGVLGLVLLIKKEWKPAVFYSCGFLLSSFSIQGMSDWIGYGRPFASFIGYLFYNSENAYAYTTGPWYQYVGLLIGALIPPTSLLLVFGFVRTWKKSAYIFWPVLAFLIVHSIFPNKQERFILPIIPFVLMLSVTGWQEFVSQSDFWRKRPRLTKGLWVWFWIFNVLLLCVCSITYSKKARVETLSYLSHKTDVHGIIIESRDDAPPMAPLFYLGKSVPVFFAQPSKTVEKIKREIDSSGTSPNYVVFLDGKNIDARIKKMDGICRALTFEQEIRPSFIDWLLYVMNPRHNINQTSYIYKGSQ
jgi:Alg9-like mannosyltransferase family.